MLRPTTVEDLDFVLALERDPENTPFIGQWSRQEHLEAIARPDREHWLVEQPSTGERLGYLIAYDLRHAGCGVYVKRIVLADKSRGLGRAALRRFVEHAFGNLDAPYVWLAVYPRNERAQRSYRAVGFTDFAAGESERARHSAAAERTANDNILMILHRAADR